MVRWILRLARRLLATKGQQPDEAEPARFGTAGPATALNWDADVYSLFSSTTSLSPIGVDTIAASSLASSSSPSSGSPGVSGSKELRSSGTSSTWATGLVCLCGINAFTLTIVVARVDNPMMRTADSGSSKRFLHVGWSVSVSARRRPPQADARRGRVVRAPVAQRPDRSLRVVVRQHRRPQPHDHRGRLTQTHQLEALAGGNPVEVRILSSAPTLDSLSKPRRDRRFC
jgi:hypothetical protein